MLYVSNFKVQPKLETLGGLVKIQFARFHHQKFQIIRSKVSFQNLHFPSDYDKNFYVCPGITSS